MSSYESIPTPFGFIDSLEPGQHILLLYDSSEYARLIECRFIKNGLLSGEQCVYATDEDSGSIVLKFLSYGIPFKYFQNGKLRIVQIREMGGDKGQALKKYKKDLETILCGLLPPFRLVSRIVPSIDTVDEILVELEAEKETHRRFDDMRGSMICPYDISKIDNTQRKQWLQDLCETHHTVIHATHFGQGVVLCPC